MSQLRTGRRPKPRPRVGREAARKRIVDAAIELVRERSFAELTVGEIMDRAGLERTIFYRHFENVGALLLGAGREAIDQLYAAQVALAETRADHGPEAVRQAMEVPVAIYSRHGPLLRAVSEAVAAEQLVAADQETPARDFDELAANSIRQAAEEAASRSRTSSRRPTRSTCSTRATCSTPSAASRGSSVEIATATLAGIWSPLLGTTPR